MRRRFRIAARFAIDWRNVLVALATVVIALMIFNTIDGAVARHQLRDASLESARASQRQADIAEDALRSAEASRDRATRRIDILMAENSRANEEVRRANEATGRLAAEATALSNQVRQLGGRPVVRVTTPGRPVATSSTTVPLEAPSAPVTTAPPRPVAPTATTRPATTTTIRRTTTTRR